MQIFIVAAILVSKKFLFAKNKECGRAMKEDILQDFFINFSPKLRRGQSLSEYAFILALVSVTAVAVLKAIGH
jgi:hypothetical protein